jgi:hypothetical protein
MLYKLNQKNGEENEKKSFNDRSDRGSSDAVQWMCKYSREYASSRVWTELLARVW